MADKYYEFEITGKGHEFRQRIIAGGEDSLIPYYTRGAFGQGKPESEDDVYNLEDLIDHKLDVPVKESMSENSSHYITLVVDNMMLGLEEDLLVSEIGIFARMKSGVTGEFISEEILYGYAYTDRYDFIPDMGYPLYREMEFNTVLAKSKVDKIDFDRSKVYATNEELQKHTEDPNLHLIGGVMEGLTDAIQEVQEVLQEHEISDSAHQELLNRKVDASAFSNHASNTEIHVSEADRAYWEETMEKADDAHALLMEHDITLALHEGRITSIENAVYNNISSNPFSVTFEDLEGINLIKGVWNKDRQRLEC